MPIVEIRALPQKPPVDVPDALSAVCGALAAALGCEPRAVWATWTTIAGGHYVEGGQEAERQPVDTHPPLVRVLALEGRAPDVVEAGLAAVAHSLAAALGTDAGNVFVRWDELPRGRVWTGGSIAR